MGAIDTEDVLGYWEEGQLYCPDCYEEPKGGQVDEDGLRESLLTSDDMDENKRYFCDKCKKEITA